jgi:hypothetical protein
MNKLLGSLLLVFALVASASAQGISMIRRGEVLRWSIERGQSGFMRVVAVDGALFEIDQTNEQNPAAGAIRMYGALVDNGRKVVLLNVGQWREVWEGALHRDRIVGTVSAGSARFSFTIFPAAHRVEGPSPFITGRTLRWETNALGGQGGTLFVTRAEGSRFYLEQTNRKNPSAGVVRLEGEIKDGRIYIYNRQWNETWVGVFGRGVVVGKVNGQAEFRIFE